MMKIKIQEYVLKWREREDKKKKAIKTFKEEEELFEEMKKK